MTWAAFTYPLAFLVTDCVNRAADAATARRVVVVGFVSVCRCLFSLIIISRRRCRRADIVIVAARIAFASGAAFAAAQLLDVTIFDRFRRRRGGCRLWLLPCRLRCWIRRFFSFWLLLIPMCPWLSLAIVILPSKRRWRFCCCRHTVYRLALGGIMSDPPFCTEADAAKTSGARLEKCFALIVRLCLNRFNVVSREEFNAHGEILTNAAAQTEYAGRKNIRLGGIAPVKINDLWFISLFLIYSSSISDSKISDSSESCFLAPDKTFITALGRHLRHSLQASIKPRFSILFLGHTQRSALIFPSRHIFHRLLNMPFYQCYPSSHNPFFEGQIFLHGMLSLDPPAGQFCRVQKTF